MNLCDLLHLLIDDLDPLSDEDLALLARMWDFPRALPELLKRLRPSIVSLVLRLAHRYGVRPEDAEDATQDAFVHFPKVVASYDHDRMDWRWGSFRWFADYTLTRWFINWVRKLRSQHRIYHGSGRLQETAHGLVVIAAGRRKDVPDSRERDPVAAAEYAEMLSEIQRVVNSHGELARQAWQGKLNGQSLRELALEAGCSRHRMKRVWRAVRDDLLVRGECMARAGHADAGALP